MLICGELLRLRAGAGELRAEPEAEEEADEDESEEEDVEVDGLDGDAEEDESAAARASIVNGSGLLPAAAAEPGWLLGPVLFWLWWFLCLLSTFDGECFNSLGSNEAAAAGDVR